MTTKYSSGCFNEKLVGGVEKHLGDWCRGTPGNFFNDGNVFPPSLIQQILLIAVGPGKHPTPLQRGDVVACAISGWSNVKIAAAGAGAQRSGPATGASCAVPVAERLRG